MNGAPKQHIERRSLPLTLSNNPVFDADVLTTMRIGNVRCRRRRRVCIDLSRSTRPDCLLAFAHEASRPLRRATDCRPRIHGPACSPDKLSRWEVPAVALPPNAIRSRPCFPYRKQCPSVPRGAAFAPNSAARSISANASVCNRAAVSNQRINLAIVAKSLPRKAELRPLVRPSPSDLKAFCKLGWPQATRFARTCRAAAACAASSACFHCSLAISALLTLGAQMIRRANTDCPQIAMGAWMRSCRHSCCYTGGSLKIWQRVPYKGSS